MREYPLQYMQVLTKIKKNPTIVIFFPDITLGFSMVSTVRNKILLWVACHKLVLKSVSYPKIVKNTPILIEQRTALMCTLDTHKVTYRWKAYIPWMSYMPI